jgi:hypothetical protein
MTDLVQTPTEKNSAGRSDNTGLPTSVSPDRVDDQAAFRGFPIAPVFAAWLTVCIDSSSESWEPQEPQPHGP